MEVSAFQERFNSLLELSESDSIRTIGLIYRPIQDFSRNYRLLWENRESEVLLQMSDIPRFYGDTSTMHLLQKWGIDTFSVRMSRYGSGPPQPVDKPAIFLKVKRFDPNPLTFKPFQAWAESNHQLGCKCSICKDMSASEFVEAYQGTYEDYPGQTFNAAMRLHEYYKSADEFVNGRKYIREGALSEYFKEKDGLRNSDTEIPGKSTTLNGYK